MIERKPNEIFNYKGILIRVKRVVDDVGCSKCIFIKYSNGTASCTKDAAITGSCCIGRFDDNNVYFERVASDSSLDINNILNKESDL